MKKVLGAILAAVMLLMMAGTALAGQGDLMILKPEEDEFSSRSIQKVLISGNKIYMFLSGMQMSLEIYDLETGETETWDMQKISNQSIGYQDEANAEAAEPEASAENWMEEVQCWFAKDGEIYGLMTRNMYGMDTNQVDGGHVRRLIFSEGQAELEETDSFTLDWSGMIETAGSWVSSRYINSSAAQGSRLYLSTYDNNGNPALNMFDLTTGEMTELIIQDLNEFTAAADGRLLICQSRWDDQPEMVFSWYDPDSESMEELARYNSESGSLSSVCYSAETDTLYFVRNGEIYAAPGRDFSAAQAVNDCPVSGGSLFADMTEDGRILIWSYNSAFLRNTDPALRSAISLRIRPYAWTQALDNAIYHFANEHADIALIREDYGDESTLLQSMMSRDGSVDVYLISLDSSAFGAIMDRGFTMDLSQDAKLTEAVERMYPFVKATLTRDGKLAAIPLNLSCDAVGYDAEAFEKLGFTQEDLPKTWDGYLDFLAELPTRLEGTKFRAFSAFTNREDLMSAILRQILMQYTVARDGEAMNSEELRSLLDRVQSIDFEALQIMTSEEMERLEEEGRYGEMDFERTGLMSSYADLAMNSYQTTLPLALSLREGEEALLPVSMSVAFINPYSEHPGEAMAFLEGLTDHLDMQNRYVLYPELNEPLHYANHEEQRAYLEKWMKTAQRSLETAEEEDRETWAEIVESYEKMLKEYDETNWMISPEKIAWQHANAQYMAPVKWNFFSALNAVEEGSQFSDLQTGFTQGTVSARELLSYIDKKVQMMRLEGN